MVRRLAFPAPPQWYGLVCRGGVCDEGRGRWSCNWREGGAAAGAVRVTERAGIFLRKHYASHKPCNAARTLAEA